MAMPAPAIKYASGAQCPTRPETTDGRPKIPLPMIVLIISAVRLHRPIVRTRPGDPARAASGVFVFFTPRESALRRSSVAPRKKIAPAYHK